MVESNQDPGAEESRINPLEILLVIVKGKRIITALTCGALVVSVVVAVLLPNVYSVTAKVLPPQKEMGGLSSLLAAGGGLASLAAGGLGGGGGGADLYLGILKSRSVEDAVIQRLDLARVYRKNNFEDTRKALERSVKMVVGKEGIISIVAEDESPQLAATLANTFIEELGKTTVRLNLSKAGTERLFLEKRLDLVKKDLKAAEEDLKTFSQTTRIVQVDSQTKASIEGIARLKAELAKQEVQLAVVSSKQTDQSPEVQALQAGIRRLKGELHSYTGGDGGGEGIPAISSVPGMGLAYARKLREFKIQEAMFEQLTKQYELAKLNEAKDSSSFQVLDNAVVPVKKSKPHRALIVLLSTVTALIVSVLYVLVKEYLARVSGEDRRLIEEIKKGALSFR